MNQLTSQNSEFIETPLGMLPKEWRVEKLGNVAEVIMGQSPPGETYNTLKKGMPFLQGKAEFGSIYPKHIKYTTKPMKIAKKGNILLSVRAPVGDVNIANIAYCIGRGLASLSMENNHFLFYLLMHFKPALEKEGTGSTFKAINKPKLKNIVISLPPLNEQKNIVYVLKTIQGLTEKSKFVLQSLRELKRSLMKHLFTYGAVSLEDASKVKLKETELGEIPENWDVSQLNTFLNPCLRKVKKPEIPYKRLGIRSHGKGTFLEYDFDPKKIALKELFVVKEKDLIVNITFAWEGAIAIVKKVDDGALVSHRFPTYLFDTRRVTPDFFKYVIIQKGFVEKLVLISPGSAGRNRVMKKSEFLKIKVSLPPLEEQTKIANILKALDTSIKTEEQKIRAVESVFVSILNNLMSAKIRVNHLEI